MARKIALRERAGAAPGILWLGGFKSDMKGTKAVALDAWAEKQGRAAIRFDAKNAGAHSNLGIALSVTGDTDGAIAALRDALRLDPQSAEAHMNLGSLLGRQGRFAEALEHLKKAHEIGSQRPDWRQPTAQLVRMTEKFVAVDAPPVAVPEARR